MRLARLGRPLAALLPTPPVRSATPACCGASRRCWRWRRRACRRRDPPPAACSRRRASGADASRCCRAAPSRCWRRESTRPPSIVLTRHGVEVVLVRDEQCCGALTHHLGRDDDALARAAPTSRPGSAEAERGGLDAILVTTSGCGTVIKDYGYMLREDRDFAGRPRESRRWRRTSPSISRGFELQAGAAAATSSSPITRRVRYSMDRKSRALPKELLSKNGFVVKDVPESHLCCGSAGTYNILQPDIAHRLRDRKVANIASVKPDMIAAGNIGCMVQIAGGTSVPVVHTIELLDWATGGPRPGSNDR